MTRPYYIGYFANLKHYARRTVIPASGGLWVALVIYAFYFLHFDMTKSILWGLFAVILHWLSELWHQLGHAEAARRTGYPMESIMLWCLFGASIYPSNEPELPSKIHIRRALGGPLASLLLAAVMAVVVFALRPGGPLVLNLARFVLVENIFVFSLGTLLPLGFTDGSTLRHHLRKP